jgi:hypothetical protein
MPKFMMAINEEDGTIDQMGKTLSIAKGDTVILALNLLNLILEKRRTGDFLTWTKDKDATKDILNEATAGSVPFRLNKND